MYNTNYQQILIHSLLLISIWFKMMKEIYFEIVEMQVGNKYEPK